MLSSDKTFYKALALLHSKDPESETKLKELLIEVSQKPVTQIGGMLLLSYMTAA